MRGVWSKADVQVDSMQSLVLDDRVLDKLILVLLLVGHDLAVLDRLASLLEFLQPQLLPLFDLLLQRDVRDQLSQLQGLPGKGVSLVVEQVALYVYSVHHVVGLQFDRIGH